MPYTRIIRNLKIMQKKYDNVYARLENQKNRILGGEKGGVAFLEEKRDRYESLAKEIIKLIGDKGFPI